MSKADHGLSRYRIIASYILMKKAYDVDCRYLSPVFAVCSVLSFCRRRFEREKIGAAGVLEQWGPEPAMEKLE